MGIELCWLPASQIPLGSLPALSCLRCPYGDDHYLTKVVPVDGSSGLQHPNHYKRFTFKMFAFVDDAMSVQKDTVKLRC